MSRLGVASYHVATTEEVESKGMNLAIKSKGYGVGDIRFVIYSVKLQGKN